MKLKQFDLGADCSMISKVEFGARWTETWGKAHGKMIHTSRHCPLLYSKRVVASIPPSIENPNSPHPPPTKKKINWFNNWPEIYRNYIVMKYLKEKSQLFFFKDRDFQHFEGKKEKRKTRLEKEEYEELQCV